MSLVFCEGFDDGLSLLGKWTSFLSATVGPAYGRNGSGVRFQGSGVYMLKQLAAADEHATLTVGVAYRRIGTNGSGTNYIVSLNSDNGSTQHMSVRLTADGSNILAVYRGSTLLATDTMTMVANQWYYIEFKVVLADAPSGSYELRVNGAMRLQASGIDTKNAGTKAVFDSLQIGSGLFQSGQEGNIDDLYVCNGVGATNNTFLGDTAIETIYPDGNGNSSQFVGSDADSVDNYQLVDETTPSTTDYVAGASVGNKDMYSFSNMVRTSGAIKGVMVSSYANKSDAAARSIRNVARSSGTEASSSSNTLTTTWTPHSNVFEVDPGTSADWTIAGVNGAEFGVEVDS